MEFLKKPQDKWEGEDEEEDVKDNWDDEEEEQTAETETDPNMVATAAPKNKAKKKQKLLEKEAAGKLSQLEIQTPEEIAAEKLRQEKLQEEAELKTIKEAFGSTEINVADPHTKDDFDEIRKRLIGDLSRYESRPVFGDFLEDFIQDLCLYLPARRLKKVKTSVEALYFQKTKDEKVATKATAGKAAGSKQKIKLNVEGDRAVLNNFEDMGGEFDDFM